MTVSLNSSDNYDINKHSEVIHTSRTKDERGEGR